LKPDIHIGVSKLFWRDGNQILVRRTVQQF